MDTDEERMQAEQAVSVWPPAPTNTPPVPQYLLEEGISALPPQSVFLVLLFGILSLGIYNVVWLSRQAKRLNALLPDFQIDITFLTVCLVLAVAGAVLNIVSASLNNSTLDTVSHILDNIYLIAALVLTFQVRSRIHWLLGARQNGPYRYSALGTFFFGILYLQFKINRNLKRWQQEQPFVGGQY